MTGPTPLGLSHAPVTARRGLSDTNLLIAWSRRAGHSVHGRLDGLRPAELIHNTRAYHSILLERPLTKGEMSANVSWRARRWTNMAGFLFKFFSGASLCPSSRVAGGGALPPPWGGGAGPAGVTSARGASRPACYEVECGVWHAVGVEGQDRVIVDFVSDA